jgi:hypothetical protein
LKLLLIQSKSLALPLYSTRLPMVVQCGSCNPDDNAFVHFSTVGMSAVADVLGSAVELTTGHARQIML